MRTFAHAGPREAHFETEVRRVTALVERGVARWTDKPQTAYRFTLKGALRVATTQFFGQLVRHKSQSDRFSRPRPGDGLAKQGFPVQPVAGVSVRPPASAPQPAPPARAERDFLH